jgi:hypothetical protein
MTIYPNKLLPTDKCLFFLEDHPVEKLTLVMFSISTLVSWKELPKWEIKPETEV